MQLVLAQVSDAEALQRYEDACKDAEETDVLPFRLQYADMSAFLKAQTDWQICQRVLFPAVCMLSGSMVKSLPRLYCGMSSMHI